MSKYFYHDIAFHPLPDTPIDPCDLAEDKSQQWQSLEHQCNRVERALLDQFEIRRRK